MLHLLHLGSSVNHRTFLKHILGSYVAVFTCSPHFMVLLILIDLGTTPVDELKILQTQIHLLHTQLLYERYKCDLHCLRNRRLFGNLRKLQGDTHEIKDLVRLILRFLDSMCDQVLFVICLYANLTRSFCYNIFLYKSILTLRHSLIKFWLLVDFKSLGPYAMVFG